jgi:hypothetical protein
MIEFELLTPWVIVDKECRPEAAEKYAIYSWSDVTGQAEVIPEPNLFVIRGLAEAAVVEAIQADGAFQLLWSREV